VLRPPRALPSLDLTRLWYNATLPGRLRDLPADLVVGFDFDGGLLPRGTVTVPYVVALKGVMADEARFETGVDRARFRALVPLERRNARRADRVVCTSAYSRDRAIAAYGLDPARVRVVPEGIAVPTWDGVERAATRRPPPRPDGGEILSVARQYRRKNTGLLLRALPRLLAVRPRCRLHVVGEGPELAALQSLARHLGVGDAVVFHGSLDGLAAVQAAYLASDAFCLPSRQEGFGLVFLEAMAARLPIVAAHAGAIPEVAPDGEASLLVDPDDDAGLAEAILRVLSEPALRERLTANGGARWRTFDWPRVAERFLAAAVPDSPSGPSRRSGRGAAGCSPP
jgi:glycosyltransferase involved in cell wall biosynthesis